jgi:hypothetical protein
MDRFRLDRLAQTFDEACWRRGPGALWALARG